LALPALAAPVVLRVAAIGAAVALGALAAARRGPERIDIVTENALDRLPDGADLRLDPANGRADAEARARRVIALGGRVWALDAALLARFRLRRLR
jgi:hypothetical protein